MHETILIVDDEPAIRQMLALTLGSAGYACREAGDVEQARAALAPRPPDLILLDWLLPGISGIEFARRLKRTPATAAIPIILLTAKGAEEDKVRGLDAGADDYVTKPFGTRELIARVRAVLRRARTEDLGERVDIGGIRIDAPTRRVVVEGRPLEFSATEFRLLYFLMAHADRVYTRGQLLDAVWGTHADIEERTVDVHVLRLRRLLAASGKDVLIETVRNVGYRFAADTTSG